MSRERNKDICEANRHICKDGSYFYDDYNIVEFNENYKKVEVFSPNSLKEIEDDPDEFWERAFCGSKGARITLLNMDSFEAAQTINHPLVMNFANAYHPGGGYKNGANAQEEDLCRKSTLYASIASSKAREMYDYNNSIKPLDSDYMLLSKHVYVFRNNDYELLDKPYHVSVMTVPPINNSCTSLSDGGVVHAMYKRARLFFLTAARNGYRSLVLGAWGCGAFCNDTRNVANMFYDLIYGEGFNEYFDEICFAVYKDIEKYNIFKDVFGEKVSYHNDYRWRSTTIDIVKRISYQNLDHFQHMYSDGANINDYNFIRIDDMYYLNPWIDINGEYIDNPWEFFGDESMNMFVRFIIEDNPMYFKDDKCLKINDVFGEEKLSYYEFEKLACYDYKKNYMVAFSDEDADQYFYDEEAQELIIGKYNEYLFGKYDLSQIISGLSYCLRVLFK